MRTRYCRSSARKSCSLTRWPLMRTCGEVGRGTDPGVDALTPVGCGCSRVNGTEVGLDATGLPRCLTIHQTSAPPLTNPTAPVVISPTTIAIRYFGFMILLLSC